MRCFLINLDRSGDRLARMCGALDNLRLDAEIEWERVAAIDGATLSLPDTRLVDETAFKWRHHALLRRGEVGCYLSHHAALTRFLATGDEMGLILEDDVELSDDLPGILGALSACPDRWDLVKLFATHPGGVIPRLNLGGRHRLVSLAFRHGSAAAYLVNRKAASRLVAGLLPMTVPYDHEFDRAWKYGFRVRAVLPFPVSRYLWRSMIMGSPVVDPTARAGNSRGHKPWYAQGGMVLFRGANDVARVWHELFRA